MKVKPIDEAALSRLYHTLTGTPPVRELTEARREARLKEQCHWEIETAREQELVEQLARALGLPGLPDVPEDRLNRLYNSVR